MSRPHLIILHVLSAASIGGAEWNSTTCNTADLQIDRFQMGAFAHHYAEAAQISEYDANIYLPKKVYDTVLYMLGAQRFTDRDYGVPCTGAYPNLEFTILGRELHIPQRYYVDQRHRDTTLCKVMLDYKSQDDGYQFPQRFQTNICRLLN